MDVTRGSALCYHSFKTAQFLNILSDIVKVCNAKKIAV